MVETKARIDLGDMAPAPGDRLVRGVHAEVAAGRTEPRRQRHRQAPPTAAYVEHGMVGRQAARLLEGLAQQQSGGQELLDPGRTDAADRRRIGHGEARIGEKGTRLRPGQNVGVPCG